MVWVVTTGIDYEGEEVESVWATEPEAQRHRLEVEANPGKTTIDCVAVRGYKVRGVACHADDKSDGSKEPTE